MPKDFYTIDAETDPFLYGRIPEPFIWGIYNGHTGDYHEFTDTREALDFVKLHPAIFFAHNGGKFDFHFLASEINTEEKLLMINARLVQAKIGKAEIRDSYALLPFPLRDIGNKKDIEYWKLEKKHRAKHMDEIKAYLKADCVELWNAINEFFNTYGRHLTCASAAIKTLMKIQKLKVPNSGQGFFNEFLPHYFGGRCQCFKSGEIKGEIKVFDINSAYPRAMLEQHPIGNDWNFEYEENPKIIGHNFYTINAISNGALCRRTKTGLTFDDDGESREYHTTGWEILAGLKTKKLKINSHIRQKVFHQTTNFREYINHFWTIRQTTKKGSLENTFAKLMMNSAYGKFAANPENYDTYVLFDPALGQFLVENDWQIRGEVGNSILCSTPLEEENARYYNVATGASITGFVRAMLLVALSNVENPIYCDTDSIIFTGAFNIDLGNELGQWKDEGTFQEGYFGGKKLYALKNKKGEIKIASKGTRLSFEQIKSIALGNIETYQQDAPTYSWIKPVSFTQRSIKKTTLQGK